MTEPKSHDVKARQVSLSGPDAENWDQFARLCGAGFHARRRRLLVLGRLRALSGRVRLRTFALFKGNIKIGQAAIATTGDRHVFIDRLMILPEFENFWREGLRSVLDLVGSGHYRYGWQWSIEPAREALVAQLPGVKITDVRPIVVQYVDFSQFPDWDAYYSALGGAVKRNGALARKHFSDIRVDMSRGLTAVSKLRRHVELRGRTLARKSLIMTENFATLRSVAGALALGEEQQVLTASTGGRILASKRLICLEDATYYLDSGRARGDNGLSWLLMTETLRATFRRHPGGKFVMGYVDYALHDESRSGGLIKSRRWCRAIDQDSSIFDFEYTAGKAIETDTKAGALAAMDLVSLPAEVFEAQPFRDDRIAAVTLSSLAQIESEWRALEKYASSFCQFFIYARVALSLAEEQGRPAYLVTIRDDGVLRGVWGLTLTRGFHAVLRPFSCGSNEEYSWPLLDDPMLAERVLRQTVTLRGLADRLMVYNALENSPLDSAAAALPFKQSIHHLQGYVVQASRFSSWSDVEAATSKKLIYQIERDLRRGAKDGRYAVAWSHTAEDALKALDFYFESKRKWLAANGKKSGYLLRAETPAFFSRLVTQVDLTATPVVVAVTLNDEPIAAAICLVGPTSVEYAMTTFDPQYGKLSPGKLLIRFLAEYAISRGKNFDFSVTLADYKARWPVDAFDYHTRAVMLTPKGRIPAPDEIVRMARMGLGSLKRRLRRTDDQPN
jgi:CelD/BcsL family acetyltransferase involved in cellulose biosynthesis